MSEDWEEDCGGSAPNAGFGQSSGGGFSSSNGHSFGGGGFSGGRGRGFGKPASVGVGRGKPGGLGSNPTSPSIGWGESSKGSGGFGSKAAPAENGTDEWDEGASAPTVSNSGGFGGGRGGFERRGGGRGGFGGRGGGGGGRGGFGGGFGPRDGGDDGNYSRGRGGRQGFQKRGFGGGDGEGDSGEEGGGRRGFGEGRGGFGRGRGGRFGGGGDGEGENGEEGGRRRGGFGGGRGGGRGGFQKRSFGEDGEDGEEGGRRGGFGGGGGGFGRKSFGGDGNESGENAGEKKREFYIPPPPPEEEDKLFATMAAGINFDKYDEIPAEVTGRDPPSFITSFEECGFFETTQKNIERCQYKRPTPVQKYAIPIILQGRDLMACAQTGSGKTAAFLLPTITRLIRDNIPGASQNDSQSPEVLIVSPTRELTLQIYGEARKFVYSSVYRPVVVYGGTSVGHQLQQVERGCNIVVGTPGRLLDFLRRGKILLSNIKTLILDEADRMLDMGFEPEVRKIVSEFGMPTVGERQTLMFSATFPEEIQKLANEFLNDYLFLTIGVVGGTTSDIDQSIIEVGEFEKKEKLQEILTSTGADRTLVFVETKRNADYLATLLSQEEFPTTSIHGDRFQREREEALRDFRSGRSRVLVATSVAARGLDIPQVKHVINYDLPSTIEEYVHRIGRTGRIGNKGQATGFFQKDRDLSLARGLVKVLSDAHQDVPEFLEQAAEEAIGSDYGPAGGRFASKDLRFKRGGRGDQFSGDSAGYGDSRGGFSGGLGGGGFGGPPVAEEEEENWG